ncbi:hypothetical protein DUNSADRAFT_3472 [Dunaliella salina]|uniref:Uncharacterized protein n=1 Tax=Dunaliella salina TaxID=3046 RepID=A0ABQ7GTV6_DUNSA|nr:hypothetical protein DUNSADRAFT_3472 [Dunaliella salina]|eukprot:KAF5838038.1 hypothetical protein DUNSADRAFT_3472 [Dunaliella salina]
MGCLGSKQAGDCCDEDPPSKPPIKPSPPRPAKQTGKIQDPPGPPVAPFAALKPSNPVYNVAGVQGALPPGGDRPATQLQGARLQSTPKWYPDVEETIVSVAEQREEWMSCIDIESGDLTTEHADTVLDGAEKLVHLFRNACGKGQQRDAAIPHIQSLQLPKRTALEEAFAKYSALGQVAIDLAGPALEGLSALPFLNPAAAVLGAVYARAAKAAQLSQNCGKLLDLMKSVDAQLARVLDSLGRRGEQPPPDVENALKELLDQIVQGGRLMQDYTQRGFVMRFILSKGDERKFAELDQGIHHSMQVRHF